VKSLPPPPGAGGASVQWKILLQSGRILGPYTTEAVLTLIREGAVMENAQIKRIGGSQWKPISSEAKFYDELLNALEGVAPPNPKVIEKMSSETVIAHLPTLMQAPAQEEVPEVPEPEGSMEETVILTHRAQALANVGPGGQVLDLQNIGNEANKDKKKKSVLTFGFLMLATAAIIYGMFFQEEEIEEKVRLLAPKIAGAKTLPPEVLRDQLQKVWRTFRLDTFESYIESQNILVELIEKAPQSLEARGFLCLTYKELWPFAKQDSMDLDTVSNLVKSTKALDPLGNYGVYCEASKLFILGKQSEARGVLDYSLNQQRNALDFVLLSLKAEVLASDGKARDAASYVERASQSAPSWVRPLYQSGLYLAQSGSYPRAADMFQAALKQNPKHRQTQIEFGVMNHRFLKNSELALNYLSGALSAKGRIIRTLEARANFALAEIWSEKKNNSKALDYALKAFQLNPGDSSYKSLLVRLGGSPKLSKKAYRNNELVFLGDQYMKAGDCLAAQAEYKAAYELDSTNALAATKAAKCLWQLNQASEAINWLNKAIESDKNLMMAYVQLADYYSQRFNFVGAIDALNRATRLAPNNNEVLRGYGLVEFRRNNMKGAIGYLVRALKAYENDIETLILLAKSYGAIMEFQKAMNFAVRAIELESTNNEAIITYAKVLVQFKGIDAGLYYIRDQVNKFSYTVDFRLALAEMYKENERYKAGIETYEQIIEADPKSKKAYLGLGECYQNMAQFDKALKSYLQAAVLDPSDAEPLYRAGVLYLDMNRFQEAVTQLQRAGEVNSLYPKINFYIGKAHYLAGNYQMALEACMAERKVNPNIADSYILAAEIHSSQRDFQKCTQEYQQAVKLRPQGAEIYVKMARCYRQAGNPDVASSMLSIAASQESGLPDIYREQGAIFEERGENTAAITAYEKYLSLSPNAPDRADIDQRINSLSR